MAMKKPEWLSEELMKKVSRHARKVCATKMNFSDMADVEQDLFCDLCKAMEYYDSARGDLNAFLEGVLRRRVKMYVRAAFAKKSGKDVYFELFDDDYHGEVDNRADALTDRIDLSNAANRLSRVQFQMYTLLKNHSTADVARFLKLPYSSLHLKMRKIHEKMRRLMDTPNVLTIERGVNMKDLSLLETLNAKEISALDAGDLMEFSAQISELSAGIKQIKEKLEDGMNLKFSEAVKNSLRRYPMSLKKENILRFHMSIRSCSKKREQLLPEKQDFK
jgi:DNA-directed RNA polymerase specialized sigma24 family protein